MPVISGWSLQGVPFWWIMSHSSRISFRTWAVALRPRISDNDPAAGLGENENFFFNPNFMCTLFFLFFSIKNQWQSYDNAYEAWKNSLSIFLFREFRSIEIETTGERIFRLAVHVLAGVLIEHRHFVTQGTLENKFQCVNQHGRSPASISSQIANKKPILVLWIREFNFYAIYWFAGNGSTDTS